MQGNGQSHLLLLLNVEWIATKSTRNGHTIFYTRKMLITTYWVVNKKGGYISFSSLIDNPLGCY